jgi:DNA-directed RNA polymerase subunit RPC12/RpoP
MNDPAIEDLIVINCRDDKYVCVTCGAEIWDAGHIALLVRKLPHKPMDPLCVTCAHDIMSAAATTYVFMDN